MPDTNLHTENQKGSPIENEIVKIEWQEALARLADQKPEIIEYEKIETTPGIKLFRGTSVCDVLYAILEKEGELISPLSYPGNDMTNDLGTIMSDSIGTSCGVANNQLEDRELLENKFKWMSETTGLSIDKIKKIGGLWQPILLELTNNLPDLYVEDHYGEIWSKWPINILRGALSEKSMEQIYQITGINIKSIQKTPVDFQSDDVIDDMILQSAQMDDKLWEESIPDEAITPPEMIEEYWENEREREIEKQSEEYFSHGWVEWEEMET